MTDNERKTVGDFLYESIEKNEYLNKLYNELIRTYTRRLFNREITKPDEKQLNDLLYFSDLLSKSTHKERSGLHKIWAQQIVAILGKLYPKNERIEFYKNSVLKTCNNFAGLKNSSMQFFSEDVLEKTVELADKEYFSIPLSEGEYFFEDQKEIFDGLNNPCFSYSAPTSMGKSFIMRVFIKQKIHEGCANDFAIIVPTKALINEIRDKLVEEIGVELKEKNYSVIVSANDIMLEQKKHYIYVMTPERFLYLINTKKSKVDYLFIDEAHKISAKDKRSSFYYDLIGSLNEVSPKTHIIFASPNIPNPEVYLSMLPEGVSGEKKAANYSPVSQIKYSIDVGDGTIKVYNDFSKKLIQMGNASSKLSLASIINNISHSKDKNIVYCSSLRNTIELATQYAKTLPRTNDVSLHKLAQDIRNQIHKDYVLADLIEKGVAFHVGYLPAGIRQRIEFEFKVGSIKTIFCTSTLIEGVNLPADNLFITSNKNGQSKLDGVSFRNLIGRVGRLSHSLFGNVFLVSLEEDKEKSCTPKYEELLMNDIPQQKLSVDGGLTKSEKKSIIESLVHGDFELNSRPKKTTDKKFQMMRKIGMIYMKDISQGRTSSVTKALGPFSNKENDEKIKRVYAESYKSTGIDISPDQNMNLHQLVKSGMTYPARKDNGEFDFDSTVRFLKTVGKAFKWQTYEKKTLGHFNDNGDDGFEFSHVKWYANLLVRWMSGNGLNSIIRSSIKYKENHPETGVWSGSYKIEDYYDCNNQTHKNLAIGETLSTIENVLLFSVANYFRSFSEEYKRINKVDYFENDWYEFVEYGTTNPLTIFLQRYGFSRETSAYIHDKAKEFIKEIDTSDGRKIYRLKKSTLLNCENEDVKHEVKIAALNTPDLFVEE